MKPILAQALALALLCPCQAWAQAPQTIPVASLAQAPKVDGKLADWGGDGWVKVPVKPALDRAEREKFGMNPDDDKNQTGSIVVQLKAGVHGGRFYVALKYPDDAADTTHRNWEWRNEKYAEGKQREDMLALRFHLAGDYDRTMLSAKDYKVDVWLWSAARTDPAGLAEDQMHHMTTAMLENAAEYSLPGGKTVYIRKQRDAGTPPYKMLPRPKEKKGEKLPSFEAQPASGSVADVAAQGEWSKGHWQLEFGRALNTGNADDVAFKPGDRITGQIAVFNRGYSEHKSVSEPLQFDFSAVK